MTAQIAPHAPLHLSRIQLTPGSTYVLRDLTWPDYLAGVPEVWQYGQSDSTDKTTSRFTVWPSRAT